VRPVKVAGKLTSFPNHQIAVEGRET